MIENPFSGVIDLRATGIEVLVAGLNFEASDVNAGAYSAYNMRGT